MNVLITGTESGIGRDVAIRLLKEGHSVYACHYRPLENVEEYYENIQDEQRFCTAVLDVTNHSRVAEVASEAIECFGQIHAIINVAGIAYFGDPDNVTIDEWETTFDVNVHGYFRLIDNLLPNLKKVEDSIIINTSSIWGLQGNANMYAYASSKHAVEGLTKGLQEYAKKNSIKVTSLVLDKVDSNFRSLMEDYVKIPKEKQKNMLSTSDVSDAVMYILNTSRTALVSTLALDAYQWR